MDSWIRDFKYALRSMAGSKAFAAIVVATMALGTGANTAVFGVLQAVVLRPLPYDEPEQLVRVYNSANGEDGYLTGLVAIAYREQSQTLEFALHLTRTRSSTPIETGRSPRSSPSNAVARRRSATFAATSRRSIPRSCCTSHGCSTT